MSTFHQYSPVLKPFVDVALVVRSQSTAKSALKSLSLTLAVLYLAKFSSKKYQIKHRNYFIIIINRQYTFQITITSIANILLQNNSFKINIQFYQNYSIRTHLTLFLLHAATSRSKVIIPDTHLHCQRLSVADMLCCFCQALSNNKPF